MFLWQIKVAYLFYSLGKYKCSKILKFSHGVVCVCVCLETAIINILSQELIASLVPPCVMPTYANL